jgi:anthranilate phosphoribosyltransferase
MQQVFQQAVTSLLQNRDVAPDCMEATIRLMLTGQATPVEVSSFLTALTIRQETVADLVTIVRLMLELVTPIPVEDRELLDTCGTGGDQMHTFNISTAVSIVAAGAGCKVAKHGNRSVSSTSGSADVLETLGVNVQLTPAQVAQSIQEIGIGFCFAPLFHSAMKYVAPIRKELGFRTVFNLLGPLTNPARAHYQLIGASRNSTAQKMAEALLHFERKRCLIVCGNDELDEVSLWGETQILVLENKSLTKLTLKANDLGLPEISPQDLVVHSPEESAAVIRDILDGNQSPARDIVLANTACALWAAGQVDHPMSGVTLAKMSIDSGRAKEVLEKLIRFGNRVNVNETDKDEFSSK